MTTEDIILAALILAAVIGGFIGAEYGSRWFPNPTIQKLLAIVLLIAGAKMIATA